MEHQVKHIAISREWAVHTFAHIMPGMCVCTGSWAWWLEYSPRMWETQFPCSSDDVIIYLQCSNFNRRDWGSTASEYPIVQWLEYTPERWQIPLQIPSPAQAQGGLECGVSHISGEYLPTALKVIREVLLLLHTPGWHLPLASLDRSLPSMILWIIFQGAGLSPCIA